jgi:flagellar biosynthesis GTPase FlhF
METKTYFANTVSAAMETARREMGAEALLVASRPAPEEVRQFGPLEVTFAWETRAAARAGGGGLEEIRREIAALRAAFVKQPPGRAEAAAPEMYDAARIPVAAFSAPGRGETKTVAFAGPAGRGKTSSLVKIAVRYGLAKQIPVRIYLAGAHGVGAVEQMAKYAAILGAPFQAVESFESLHLALAGERWKGLVLIETPGAAEGQEMEAMGKFFAREEIERHLVLRADASSADMQYMLTRFAPVRPSRLLFTGVDEAVGLGAAVETMVRSGIPAALLGTGAQIPGDLEEADAAKLARAAWGAGGKAARAAA